MENNRHYQIIPLDNGKILKSWTKGVSFDDTSQQQLKNLASLPFIYKWLAVMPDVHAGIGATVGSVIPTHKAIIPAAVGVDIGCGMMAVKTTLSANDLPDNLYEIRSAIEQAVPHGFSLKKLGQKDKGSWQEIPAKVLGVWQDLKPGFEDLLAKHPAIRKSNNVNQLGTLGTGNHFIEICLDENNSVWVMLHSGSRGVGGVIGRYFIEKAKKDMQKYFINLADKDLAYLPEGTDHFIDYVQAVNWAQEYARYNREIMMANVLETLGKSESIPAFTADLEIINCHHNYVAKEHHFGQNVYITRKGAIRAKEEDMGIIPGSMGAKSFIVKGKGSPDSFNSCSHGAGRIMSRREAERRFTLADQIAATEGVECRKSVDVIDEIPMSYKPIDAVMAAQKDLVEILYILKQIVCVKG